MMAIARTIVALIAALQGLAAGNTTRSEAVPILKLSEGVIDLHPSGITATSCIVVRSDGTFHLEKRMQKLPSQRATLQIYEATLDSFEVTRLESILDAPALRNLGEYKPPQFPVAVSTIAGVAGKVMRGEKVQSLGYFAWNEQPGTADASPESTPEEVKREWKASRVVLSPLAGWFHEIAGRTWEEVDESHSDLCQVPELDK